MPKHRIVVNGRVILGSVPNPYVVLEIIPIGGSTPIQSHSISSFRSNGKYRVAFCKLGQNRWHYVFISLYRGGPSGTRLYQTVRAIKTGP